jgi:predicted hotdog family 3-hydroxylacyl-ACP dehydratase
MERPELRHLLPHQGEALWLQRLLGHNGDTLQGETDWSCLARFGDDASPALLFEAAAQLCAAHGALLARPAAAAAAGATAMIGKLSAMRLHFEPLHREGTLAIRVDRQAASPAGAQYTFAVYSRERLLLDGTLLLVADNA